MKRLASRSKRSSLCSFYELLSRISLSPSSCQRKNWGRQAPEVGLIEWRPLPFVRRHNRLSLGSIKVGTLRVLVVFERSRAAESRRRLPAPARRPSQLLSWPLCCRRPMGSGLDISSVSKEWVRKDTSMRAKQKSHTQDGKRLTALAHLFQVQTRFAQRNERTPERAEAYFAGTTRKRNPPNSFKLEEQSMPCRMNGSAEGLALYFFEDQKSSRLPQAKESEEKFRLVRLLEAQRPGMSPAGLRKGTSLHRLCYIDWGGQELSASLRRVPETFHCRLETAFSVCAFLAVEGGLPLAKLLSIRRLPTLHRELRRSNLSLEHGASDVGHGCPYNCPPHAMYLRQLLKLREGPMRCGRY